ncbi:hypothetical protein [Rhodococcoides yunnanense]|uniref:hypothetical protein n=1 Tax=Rhodococcoides yunnanense TaxID=278209 RepID=UPI000935256D|nr:hypothetical protein [Rhodococcus yunnanensis]
MSSVYEDGLTGVELRAERVALVAATISTVLVAVGSFGPWAVVRIYSRNGIEGDGRFTLAAAVVAGVAVLTRYIHRRRWYFDLASAAGGVTVVVAVVAIIRVVNGSVELSRGIFNADIGWGLWLVFVGGLLLVASSLLGFMMTRNSDS